ncbi:transcription factor [Fusarium albosuccineum]|uniref:Transcription factor n=1 Tax=Fusarium albosuccineum TaxID=1237068 RepID=A0A8H4PDY5_9HYPO|nr:transcription factor [Fusarium albosuccineum]
MDTAQNSSVKEKKNLSCKRCQYRKLKCSRTQPCQNCIKAQHSCEYNQVDRKRRPASHEYVKSLEDRVAWLESFITKVQVASPRDRDTLLSTVSFRKQPSVDSFTAPDTASAASNGQSDLQPGFDGSLIYHGATSIYHAQTVNQAQRAVKDASTHPPLYTGSESNFAHVLEHFGINIEDEVIAKALMQFFKWQYPQFMFIYREGFLQDHFSDRVNCKYWSSALLLSICALGTLMSPDEEDRRSSEQFYTAAESILMASHSASPKTWASKKTPRTGSHTTPPLTTDEDVDIRRRIYWGAYISDKLISLILGRPVYLYYDDAEVEPMEQQPDYPELRPWRSVGFSGSDSELTKIGSMVPYYREQIHLSRVIERMLCTLFSPRSNMDGMSRRACLDTLNIELCRWKAGLPGRAEWNKWEPIDTPLIPSVAMLHLLFHSARIALNYDQALSSLPSGADQGSRQYCLSSAEDIASILRRYRHQYGLRHAPLILVYGVVQASRAMNTLGVPEEAQPLSQALGECAVTWNLAEQAKELMLQKAAGGGSGDLADILPPTDPGGHWG